MRCDCCNKNLNNFESTLRGANTGDFLNMCTRCLKDLDIALLPNKADPDEAGPEDDFFEDDGVWEDFGEDDE